MRLVYVAPAFIHTKTAVDIDPPVAPHRPCVNSGEDSMHVDVTPCEENDKLGMTQALAS